jgi:hypothetical protein
MLVRMIKLLSLSVLFCVFATACSADVSDAPKEPANREAAPVNQGMAQVVDAEIVERDAKCGCSIEGVGHCDNFIMIEGKYVPMIHASLGKMEFCKFKDAGAKVKVKGAMQDGKYIAAQWELVN